VFINYIGGKDDKGCFASLDGDADRIVFFGAINGLQLCDGDKIGVSPQ
jgi:phosphomannomutase